MTSARQFGRCTDRLRGLVAAAFGLILAGCPQSTTPVEPAPSPAPVAAPTAGPPVGGPDALPVRAPPPMHRPPPSSESVKSMAPKCTVTTKEPLPSSLVPNPSKAKRRLQNTVVLVGMDGLEPTLVERMTGSGDLPNFKRVGTEGFRTSMRVGHPIVSPSVWTTIASGYAPRTHGIPDWTGPDGSPFRSMDVKVKRLWDITTANGKTAWVFNWLLTMPVSTIKGVMTSEELVFTGNLDTEGNHAPMQDPTITTKMLVSPTSFCETAAQQVPDIDWVSTTKLAYQFDRYSAVRHPMIRDETAVRMFEALVGSQPPDLAMVYLQGADALSHRIWPFTDDKAVAKMTADPGMWQRSNDALSRHEFHKRRRPFSDGPTTEKELKEGRAIIEDYYRYLDSLLGRIIDRVDPNTSTVLVVSDHGFFTADTPVPLFPEHSERAALMGWGRGVMADPDPGTNAKDVDIAPTVYALLGLPSAADMPGRMLTEHFKANEPTPVNSYATASELPATDRPMDFRRLEELKMLGYVDDEGKPIATPGRGQNTQKPR